MLIVVSASQKPNKKKRKVASNSSFEILIIRFIVFPLIICVFPPAFINFLNR